MCKNCKGSELGVARQAELDAATLECQKLNINPATIGFLVRHAYQGRVPSGQRLAATPEQIEAVKRYNAAKDAMKELHNDYVWDRGRKGVEEARKQGVKPLYFTHGDPQLRHTDLSELGISREQATNFDLIAIQQAQIAEDDQKWLDAEQRS